MGSPLIGQSESFSSKCGFPPKKKNPKLWWGVFLIVVN